MNKFKLIILSMTLFSSSAWSCGEYLVKAQVSMKDGLSSLIVYPGTISEINLKIEFNESAKLSPYINRVIEAKVTIEEKMDFTRGNVSKIENIKAIVPDPLAPDKGMGLKLIKETDCKKK